MKIAIVSDRFQYESLLKSPGRRDFFVICDNPQFEDRLRADGIRYAMITEYDIRDLWPEINRWGCEVACEAIRTGQEKSVFRSVDMASVIFHHFSRTLVHIRKNHAFAELVLNKYHPEVLWIPDQTCSVSYPDFSGNYFFRYFLEKIAIDRGIGIERVFARSAAKTPYLEDRRPFFEKLRRSILQLLKRVLGSFLGPRPCQKDQGAILACGGLNHLSSLIIELNGRGERIALFSDLFQGPWARFAEACKIPYFQKAHFSKRPNDAGGGWVRSRKQELLTVLKLLSERHLLRSGQYDFFGAISDLVFSRMDAYLSHLARRYIFLERLFDELEPRACLAHDDFSLSNGFMAAFARLRGVPVFCVSHATLALDFEVPQDKRAFCQSITFVNSEFEKSVYEKRGWVGGDFIRVSGVPRYDRLLPVAVARRMVSIPMPPVKILYCATGLWKHSPDQRGFLGSDVNLYQQTQRPAFQCMIQGLRGLPVELIVKPHSHVAEPLWNEEVKKQGPLDFKVRVLPHSADIFDLYRESHVMLISYWSTALLEAAMIGLPTIFIDPFPPYSRSLYKFSENGFCSIVKTPVELRERLQRLQKDGAASFEMPTAEKREYYLGVQTPGSTRSVADEIIQRMKSSPMRRVTHE